ncbi:hypothetical protein J2W24_003106 [Variovorax boronicumulans]|uniref:hypothetical protein n=1 Tax=Variovorax boronicumulans TaxID=436515 RepID=UPI002780940A|nr:hypothetical protein [Variovorax boronicumulans]MDP9917455.1 hypothetical protein [Variovorax boronicumulans]
MNQTDVRLQIAAMAEVGGALTAKDAMNMLATMIGQLDMRSDSYDLDVAALLKIGATLWDLSTDPTG